MNSATRPAALSIAVIVLFFLASGIAVGHDAGDEDRLEDAKELGAIDTMVEVETPPDLHMFFQAYVVGVENATDRPVTEWERINADTELQAPNEVWGLPLGSSPQLFTGSASFDLSRLQSGTYYLLMWGCETTALPGKGVFPDNCQWINPYQVRIERDELRIQYDNTTYIYDDRADRDAVWQHGGTGDAVDLIIRQGDQATITIPDSADRITVAGDRYERGTDTADDKAIHTFSERLGTYMITVPGDTLGEPLYEASVKVAPGRDHPGTHRFLALPVMFEDTSQFFAYTDAFRAHWAEVSPVAACQEPEDAVEVVTPTEQCPNKDELVEACGIDTGINDVVDRPLYEHSDTAELCSVSCGEALTSCAEELAETYDFGFDKPLAIVDEDVTYPHQEAPFRQLPRMGCSTNPHVEGQAGLPDTEMDTYTTGVGITLSGAWYAGERGGLIDGVRAMTHEIGHSYGLCHGAGPQASRPDDAVCPNQDADAYTHPGLTKHALDRVAEMRATQDVDLMNYGRQAVFTPDAMNHIHTAIADDMAACNPQEGNVIIRDVVYDSTLFDTINEDEVRVDILVFNTGVDEAVYSVNWYDADGELLVPIEDSDGFEITVPAGEWGGIILRTEDVEQDIDDLLLDPATGGDTLEILRDEEQIKTVERGQHR